MRWSGPVERAGGRESAETAGGAALGADIREPPFLVLVAALLTLRELDRTPGDGREHLFKAVGLMALEELRGLALLDQAAAVDHAEAVAVALGLLHHVGGHEDRRAG